MVKVTVTFEETNAQITKEFASFAEVRRFVKAKEQILDARAVSVVTEDGTEVPSLLELKE
jgi:hypothetical protein